MKCRKIREDRFAFEMILVKFFKRRHRLTDRTPLFQGGNTGSTPVGAAVLLIFHTQDIYQNIIRNNIMSLRYAF